MDTCYMKREEFKQGARTYRCSGKIKDVECGPLCPFFKTLKDQQQIEKKCLEHLSEDKPFLYFPYITRSDNVLHYSEGQIE